MNIINIIKIKSINKTVLNADEKKKKHDMLAFQNDRYKIKIK